MMAEKAVLIVSQPLDQHVDAVIRELATYDVDVFRLHPEDVLDTTTITLEICDGEFVGEIRNAQRSVLIENIVGAWFRRPRAPKMLGDLAVDILGYCTRQYEETLQSLYATLEDRWLASPDALRLAERKPNQLAAAARVGLKTPATLITNDSERAVSFRRGLEGRRCAVKPLHVQGINYEGNWRMPWTVAWDDDVPAEAITLAPAMFQMYVDKAFELRCVVIGNNVFAAKIESQNDVGSQHDWRAAYTDLPLEPFSLPDDVQSKLLELVEGLNIHFASADFIVTPERDFIFLELNPNGQWLWLDSDAGLPLTKYFAAYLTGQVTTTPPLSTARAG